MSGRVSFGIRLTAVNLSAVSDKEAVLTSEEMVEEQAADEEVVEEEEEEDGAVAGGEGEALRSLLEVGNFGVLALRSRELLSSETLFHVLLLCPFLIISRFPVLAGVRRSSRRLHYPVAAAEGYRNS